MSDPSIRLSDAEREAAAAALGDHFVQGRLTADEHAERLDQVWRSRTRGELVPIFRDLPGRYVAAAASPEPDGRSWGPALRPSRRRIPGPLLALLVVLVVMSAIAHFPLFLFGFAVFWFVVLRHRGPRWAHRRWR